MLEEDIVIVAGRLPGIINKAESLRKALIDERAQSQRLDGITRVSTDRLYLQYHTE